MVLLDQTVELAVLPHSAKRWLLREGCPILPPKYIPMLQHFAVQEHSA